ncbi:hypothetical protein ACLQ24_29990, partial [Micromonospora sp. DT4]|uniref:hypothetical protein n=1 Tax=Micromonospora sp. DT4 TaxID=3393438 RepID=UPI003CEA25AF
MAGVLRSVVVASAVGGDGEPEAPPQVFVDAVEGFPVWDGRGDCVVRADRLLTALGVGDSDKRGDWLWGAGAGAGAGSGVTVVSLAARLGGVFTPATVGDVARLGKGQSTLVYRRDVSSPQHVVVVHRSVEGHWWLVQAQASEVAERVVRFDPTVEGRAEEVLGRLILVPADAHGRLLSVGDGGQVTTGDPVTG